MWRCVKLNRHFHENGCYVNVGVALKLSSLSILQLAAFTDDFIYSSLRLFIIH